MKVKEILNLYSYLCAVAIIENDSKPNDNKLNILWRGAYDRFHQNKLEYKNLRKYLDYEVESLSSFLNAKTNSQLQIFINLI